MEKECFIIMPLTIPDNMLNIYRYRDSTDHFKHILQCLFTPAIKKAGYVPKPPIAQGADLIQGEIVNNLEGADIVLCDISCLNPNVFFEYGIRTALNKAVCVVKDDKTDKVPFDTAIINYQEYDSAIEPWNVEQQIDKIAEHIKASVERSKGENNLWKYVGAKIKATPYQAGDTADAKLEYLRLSVESMKEKLDRLTLAPRIETSIPYWSPTASGQPMAQFTPTSGYITSTGIPSSEYFPGPWVFTTKPSIEAEMQVVEEHIRRGLQGVIILEVSFDPNKRVATVSYRGDLPKKDAVKLANEMERIPWRIEYVNVAPNDKV